MLFLKSTDIKLDVQKILDEKTFFFMEKNDFENFRFRKKNENFWKFLKIFKIVENPYWKIDFLKQNFRFWKIDLLKKKKSGRIFRKCRHIFFQNHFSPRKKIFFDSDFFSVLEFVPTLDSRHSYSQSTAHRHSTRCFIQKCTVMNVFLETLSYYTVDLQSLLDSGGSQTPDFTKVSWKSG